MIHISEAVARAIRPCAQRDPPTEPFTSAEQAWFWTMGALRARHEGASSSGRRSVPRPCDPDDVVKCLDQLYRNNRVDLAHARILRRWGERQEVPDASSNVQNGDAALWREAMERLDPPLRLKGIIA